MLSALSLSVKNALSPGKPGWGSGERSAGKTRTLEPRQFSPTENFLDMLEEAELRDSKTLVDFMTPQRKTMARLAHELTPPGAPEQAERRTSRMDSALEFMGELAKSTRLAALAAWHAPVALAKSTKAAVASTTGTGTSKTRRTSKTNADKENAQPAARTSKTSADKENAQPAARTSKANADKENAQPAARTSKASADKENAQPAARTSKATADKENAQPAAVPKAAKAAGKGLKPQQPNQQQQQHQPPKKPKPKATQQQQQQPKAQAKAQTKQAGGPAAPLSPRARAAKEQAAKVAASKPAGKRKAQSDPLMQHGYKTQGPIAAGAFSTIVRAIKADGGMEVAVKSFDNKKCEKDYQHRECTSLLAHSLTHSLNYQHRECTSLLAHSLTHSLTGTMSAPPLLLPHAHWHHASTSPRPPPSPLANTSALADTPVPGPIASIGAMLACWLDGICGCWGSLPS